MGLSLFTGVMTQLSGNAYLKSLLGVDLDDGGPAIYYGAHDMVTAPVYPCLTFYEEMEIPDKRYLGLDINDTVLCFQSWTQSMKAGDSAQIMAALKPMFRDTWFSLPNVPGPLGTVVTGMFWSEQLGAGVSGIWDKSKQAYMGLARYAIKTGASQ